jgi:hypothetical protein
LALKDTKGTCNDEMIVPFVALTIEASVLRRLLCEPRSARGAFTDDRADDRRANPTFQGQKSIFYTRQHEIAYPAIDPAN